MGSNVVADVTQQASALPALPAVGAPSVKVHVSLRTASIPQRQFVSAVSLTDHIAGNRLLAALPREERERLLPHLDLVQLRYGQPLYEPRAPLVRVHFPTNCVASLFQVMEDGRSVQVAMVGNEGLVGVSAFMGGETTNTRAEVSIDGMAIRIPAAVLRQAFQGGGPVQSVLLHYVQALLAQTIQNIGCCARHTLQQRLSRWLLACLDRVPGSELKVTHELLAVMLGVRRESVSEAARAMQLSGLIQYRRGNLTVVDRAGLQAQACECYDVVRRTDLHDPRPVARPGGRE
jgi:CRP-like cAMP-binding protein